MSITLLVQNGKFRRKKIKVPPASLKGRHNFTSGVVKEAIFQLATNLIETNNKQYSFFDLCSGSGQVGIEALSAGFGKVHLVELDRNRISNLIQVIDNFPGNREIHNRDFRRCSNLVLSSSRSVIFLDPPYSFWDKNGDSQHVYQFLQQITERIDAGISSDQELKTVGSEINPVWINHDIQNRQLVVLIQAPNKKNSGLFQKFSTLPHLLRPDIHTYGNTVLLSGILK